MADGRGFSFQCYELIESGTSDVAKAELGTKRVCPETGRKFYDLNKNPIVSPFTGTEYPLSFFEKTVKKDPKESAEPEEEVKAAEPEAENEASVDAEDTGDTEVVSLEDVEDDDDVDTDDPDVDDDADDDVVDIPDLDDVEDDDGDDSDVFLEEDEDGDDVSDIIVGGPESDEDDR